MKKYQEPEIKFVSLKPSGEIAAQCWSYANHSQNSPTYYYDLQGTGSLEFRITEGEGGCDGGIPTEVYYVVDTDQDGHISGDEKWPATTEQYNILYEAMHLKGEIGNGNSGENTASSSFAPGDLPPQWS